jgi:hypothetical protein
MVLLDPWVFPPGAERPDPRRIIAELVDFQLARRRPPAERMIVNGGASL